MTIYRNEYGSYSDGQDMGSVGFSWHTAKREALKAAIEHKRGEEPGYMICTAEALQIPSKPTAKQLVSFLNRQASHPDNG